MGDGWLVGLVGWTDGDDMPMVARQQRDGGNAWHPLILLGL